MHEAGENALPGISARTVASTAEVKTGPRPAHIVAPNERGLGVQTSTSFEAYLRQEFGLDTYYNETG